MLHIINGNIIKYLRINFRTVRIFLVHDNSLDLKKTIAKYIKV